MKRLTLMVSLVAAACGKVEPKEEVAQVKQADCDLDHMFTCIGSDDPTCDACFGGGIGGGGAPNGGPNNCSKCVGGTCFKRMFPSGQQDCYYTMDLYCLESGGRCP